MIGGKPLFAFIGGGAAGAAELLTAANTIHTFTIPFKCIPIRCGVTVTTAVITYASTVKFTGAGGTAGNCGTLIVPITATAGKVYYENTDYIDAGTGSWLAALDEGDQVTVIVSVPDGTPGSGAGIPWLLVEVNPEMPANNSAMNAV